MKNVKLTSICLVLTILTLYLASCSKTKSFIGTYNGVTTTSGTAYISIPDYAETNETIPGEQQNVTFEITKGSENNKIVLKQVNGTSDQQFEAIGVVDDKTATFLPFTMPLKYGPISVNVQVSDMTATVEDGTLTYTYSFGYYYSLLGTVNITVNASGSAEKK